MNPLFTISHTKPDVNDFEHVSAFLENNSLPERVSVMHREEGAWMIDFEVKNQADKGAAVHWSMFQGVRCSSSPRVTATPPHHSLATKL